MTLLDHDLETRTYPLENGFVLERADPAEFVRHWTVYRGIDEDFSPSLEARGADLREIPFAFWIRHQGQIVAGVVMLPNNIGEFFLVPPFRAVESVLPALLPLLRSWSRPGEVIRAQGITEEHLPAFIAAGFRLEEARRWMIRPTAPFEPTWETLRPQALERTQAAAIAQLLHRAFSGNPSQDGRRDLPSFATSVEGFFANVHPESITWQASAVVRASVTDSLVAVCLVNLHKDTPTIQYLATAPEHRGRGLASNLIRQSLDQLHPHFDWAKLAVTCNTPAERLYQQLGFQAAPLVGNLILP